MPVVEISMSEVVDWQTFHSTFAQALGFPDFYGANMNAWVDCLTYLEEDDGMSSIIVEPGDILTLSLLAFAAFRRRCPEIAEALVDSAAFVNFRRTEDGDRAIVALSYSM